MGETRAELVRIMGSRRRNMERTLAEIDRPATPKPKKQK
jgi:hypothetical protein